MLLLALLAAVAPPQSEPDPRESRLLGRLADLPAAEQERIAAALAARQLAWEHPLCRAAAALQEAPRLQAARRLAPEPARAFDATEYAPALRLRTVVWQPQDPAWKSIHRSLLGRRTPPPPPPERWAWDPGRDALIEPAAAIAPDQGILAGFRGGWPPDGRVTAWALGALDELPELNPVADYFEHAYRNRGGGIYAGIRLWDVWDCGREFEVSDVEAIAWLRTIGGDTSTVSPIPGARHSEIYARIKASFAAWRVPWSLRQALAARMLQPWQAPEPLFAGATELLDTAWVLCEHDPARMNALLAAHPGRDAFLAAVRAEAERVRALPEAPAAWSRGWEARASLAAALADAAAEVLREEGLLGLGVR